MGYHSVAYFVILMCALMMCSAIISVVRKFLVRKG